MLRLNRQQITWSTPKSSHITQGMLSSEWFTSQKPLERIITASKRRVFTPMNFLGLKHEDFDLAGYWAGGVVIECLPSIPKPLGLITSA